MSLFNNSIVNLVIADDEPLARLRLVQLCEDLNDECPNKIVAQYAHGSALVNVLSQWQKDANNNNNNNNNIESLNIPDAILLDINMPGLNGVEIASFLKQYIPHIAVVFVTAEPEHAVEAFEVGAIDYVLKPVRSSRLLSALQKIQHNKLNNLNNFNGLTNNALVKSAPTILEPQITVHKLLSACDNANTTKAIPASQVAYFKADNKITLVRTTRQAYEMYTSTLSLGELEAWLIANRQHFVRVHRNALLRQSLCGGLIESKNTIKDKPEILIQVLNAFDATGKPEVLQVSRRMLSGLRDSLRRKS
jgi:two-component system, LytTR family, response regulator AlgR